jgi:general secretion pathway protein I
LEVLVAFVIMALTLGALYQVFSSGLRTAVVAEQYSTATQIAKSLLTEYSTIRPLEAGEYNGQREDTPYHWRTSITPIDTSTFAPTASEQFEALEITVEVSWPSGVGKRSLSLRTLRLQERS